MADGQILAFGIPVQHLAKIIYIQQVIAWRAMGTTKSKVKSIIASGGKTEKPKKAKPKVG